MLIEFFKYVSSVTRAVQTVNSRVFCLLLIGLCMQIVQGNVSHKSSNQTFVGVNIFF